MMTRVRRMVGMNPTFDVGALTSSLAAAAVLSAFGTYTAILV